MLEITDNPDVPVADYEVAKRMAETLHKHYPGHLWAVTCDHKNGIASIRNLMLSGNWGFIIKLVSILHDPSMKAVTKAGGELLERYKLERGSYRQDQYEALEHDFAGIVIGDKS